MCGSDSPSLTVFFDGFCPLCSREIAHYRKLKGSAEIQWIDITQPDFDAGKEGLDPELVHKFFHVKTENGLIVTGCGRVYRNLETVTVPKNVGVGEPVSRCQASDEACLQCFRASAALASASIFGRL